VSGRDVEILIQKLAEGVSLPRAVLETYFETSSERMREAAKRTIMGGGKNPFDLQGGRDPFEQLINFILFLRKTSCREAGKFSAELVNALLLTMKLKEERESLLRTLLLRSLISVFLLGSVTAVLGRIAPFLFALRAIVGPSALSPRATLPSFVDFTIGVISALSLAVFFRRRAVLKLVVAYSIGYFLGYTLAMIAGIGAATLALK